MKRSDIVAGVFIMFALAPLAHAGLVEYTDRASFNADTSNPQVIDFEGIAPSGGLSDTCGNLTLGGVHFVGTSGDGQVRCGTTFVVSSSLPNPNVDWGTGDSLNGDRFGYFQSSGIPIGNLEALLPDGTYAFGTDLTVSYYDSPSRTSDVLLDVWVGPTGYQFTFSADTTTSPVFRGFVSTDPITSFQYRTLGVGYDSAYGGFDNFTTASTEASGAPEPGTVVLLGIGLAGLAFGRRFPGRIRSRARRRF